MLVRSSNTVGVIVARFQVPRLHQGHIDLINFVRARHKNVLIVLGVHGGVRNKINPLTFAEREVMIRQTVRRKLIITSLLDHPFSHDIWSQNLDKLVADACPGLEVVVYSSRDGIADPQKKDKNYTGSLKTVYVPPTPYVSGTATRAALLFPHTEDARAAIIYDLQHRHPFMYSTSDLAITDRVNNRVLLIGKKAHNGLRSFVGGHAEKADGNGQVVAVREGGEEVLGISFGVPQYLDTKTVDDPRYRGTSDGVMTTFYAAPFQDGTPMPGDDADFVDWFHRNDLSRVLVPWHRPLGEILNKNWSNLK